ncbi:hypothetical protein GGH94_001392 [Coemansia aciculifera]|uniref:Uncharacterized protein n=1 Tax=Coemansia aciculifera TaxID=417176 RepID=A0A9W8IUZ1_9FUNG|nr:hypothetical protein GGH94_001392 [Coemansia aciculifera]
MDSSSGSIRNVKFTAYLNGENGKALSFKENITVAQLKDLIAKAYGTTAEAIVYIPINDPLNRENDDDGGARSELAINVILDDTQDEAFNSGNEIEPVYVDVGTIEFANSNPTITHRE